MQSGSFMENMKALFTVNNMGFLLEGLEMTLYIAVISILLSLVIGTVLAVMRNNRFKVFQIISGVYIEIVRNIPNLLWIYVVFVVFQLKSVEAGVVSFTIFTSAALAEIVRGGLNAVSKSQTETALSQGFSRFQTLWYIVLPQGLRSMLPAIISQFVTVIKDTSFLWSVIAIQELTGKATILMGRYHEIDQVFILYALLAVVYFIVNYILSLASRRLAKKWALQG